MVNGQWVADFVKFLITGREKSRTVNSHFQPGSRVLNIKGSLYKNR